MSNTIYTLNNFHIIENKSFKYLTVIGLLATEAPNGLRLVCLCKCGNIVITNIKRLIGGNTTSCGCYRSLCVSLKNIKNIDNTKFGYLTVINSKTTRLNKQVKCICDCGNEFFARRSDIVNGYTKSCGCYKLKRMAGEYNPNWKGGITPEYSSIRCSSKYGLWRFDVFARDNYTCLKCKDSSGGNLQAHHMNCFSDYPELRIDIDNGITLCKICHKNFHDIYTNFHNTKEQYLEWMYTKGD